MAGPSPVEQTFDPRKWSPSRANAMASCGIAFKLKYIDKVPEERSGSAALFGSVVHQALEWWSPDREQDLLTLMRKAWPHVVHERGAHVVAEFLDAYGALSGKAIRLEYEIRQEWAARGKESKQPRMTKQFKTSQIAKDIDKLVGRYAARIAEESPWRFAESGTLPGLYDESLVLSRRYEQRWRHLPNSLFTEFGFEVPFRGFTLRGYIDVIEALTDKKTQERFLGVTDYKTYAREAAAQKDWRQKAVYAVAMNHLIATGQIVLPAEVADLPLRMGVDYVRMLRRDWSTFAPEDFDRLERELIILATMAENELFLPAEKNYNPDFCAFPSQCCLRSCQAAGGSAEPVEVEL